MSILSSHWRNEKSIRRGLVYGIFLLCAYAAWMGGGVPTAVQWPMSLLAIVLCMTVLCLPVDTYREIRSRISGDPVSYIGCGFLLLLLIQWVNSGHPSGQKPALWIPGSVSHLAAAEMIHWFFPAFTVVMIVRNVLNRSEIKQLVHLLVWNSAALACVGIMQRLLNVNRALGVWDAGRSDFFATFAYPNHAAAWFYLHAALAVGLAHDAEIKRKPRLRALVWGICFLCCIVASFLTVSRIGALVALILMLAVFIILMRWAKTGLRGAGALNAYLALSAFALIGVVSFFGAGGGDLAREVAGKSVFGDQSLANDLSIRVRHVSVALESFRSSPWFGCGGGWFDDWVMRNIPPEERHSWMVGVRASVHCDPVQFLAEFGVVGGLSLVTMLVMLLSRLRYSRPGVLLWWGCGGLTAVMLHSLIDLPFRCPAILLAWCCLLAALSRKGHRKVPLNM